MINFVKIGLATLSVLMAGACVREDICSSFPHRYDVMKEPVYKMKIARRVSDDVRSSLKRIDKCYPSNRYQTSSGEISFEDFRRYNGQYIAIYEMSDVNDVKLAFLIGEDGSVLKSFQFSTL